MVKYKLLPGAMFGSVATYTVHHPATMNKGIPTRNNKLFGKMNIQSWAKQEDLCMFKVIRASPLHVGMYTRFLLF